MEEEPRHEARRQESRAERHHVGGQKVEELAFEIFRSFCDRLISFSHFRVKWNSYRNSSKFIFKFNFFSSLIQTIPDISRQKHIDFPLPIRQHTYLISRQLKILLNSLTSWTHQHIINSDIQFLWEIFQLLHVNSFARSTIYHACHLLLAWSKCILVSFDGEEISQEVGKLEGNH